MKVLNSLAINLSQLKYIRTVLYFLMPVFLLLNLSACSESDEVIADNSRRLDVEFESMVRAVFKRDSWIENAKSQSIAYMGKATVKYPDKSGAYLVYGLQHVNTVDREDAYVFLFCKVDIGYPTSLCASNSQTVIPAEKYSVGFLKELVKKSNAKAFNSFEKLNFFQPNQRSYSADINYEPNFK